MFGSVRKTLAAALAALAFGFGVVAATPSQARHIWLPGGHHGGWHHGGHWRGRPYVGANDGLGALDAFAIFGVATLPYAFNTSCWQYHHVYDAYGRYLGRRAVYVCN